jgi:hypothetical protein
MTSVAGANKAPPPTQLSEWIEIWSGHEGESPGSQHSMSLCQHSVGAFLEMFADTWGIHCVEGSIWK